MKLPSLEFGLDFHSLVYAVPMPLQDSLVISKLYPPVKIILFLNV